MRFSSPIFSILFLAAVFTCEANAQTVEDAQKAYVSGNWKGAAEAFEAACPSLEASKRSECALWGVLARSQMGTSKDFSLARKRLDSLISKTPDTLSVSSDLYMTRAQFELYLKRPDLSFKSLKAALDRANGKQYAVLFQVCKSLYQNSPMDSVQSLCKEIERKKSEADSSTACISSSSPEATSSSSEQAVSSSNGTALSAEAASSAFEASSSSSAGSSSSPTVSAVSLSSGAVSSSAKASADWSLQVGAFSIYSNAELLESSLRAKKIDARIEELKTEDRTLYLVKIGYFESREQAVEYGNSTLAGQHLEFNPVKKQ